MLCATIKTDNPRAIQRANREADLIELSLDLFKPKNLKELRSLCHKPVIFKVTDYDESLLSYNPDYIDLPHTTCSSVFHKIATRHIQRICSYHDFETSAPPQEIFESIRHKPAEIYKIATMATSSIDALEMLSFLKEYGLRFNIIGLCMGELGEITRILGTQCGSLWTYAPLSDDQQTAPGQLLLRDLVTIYNVRQHSSTTSFYGLIGDPVNKSQSHLTHNYAFKKLGIDAVYVKMRIAPGEIEKTLELLTMLNFKGLSVTMPLKEAIKDKIDECDGEAINTLVIKKEGLFGCNTDGVGALNALEKRGKVVGKRIVFIGAGGAASAIVDEAKKRGASIIVVNRTVERAQKLAAKVYGDAFALSDFSKVALLGYDILINCTCVGMGSDCNLPVPAEDLLRNRLVMDIIQYPSMTPLLKAAMEKGCEIVQGSELFIQQAIGQYCYWFKDAIVES